MAYPDNYTPPTPGRFDQRLNSTNYEHPQETNLLNVHRAMEYDAQGEPVLRTADTQGSYTSKNRRRVSQFSTWFFSTSQFDTGLDVWDQTTTDGATITHDPNQSAVIMAVSATPGSKAIRQSRQVMPYIPGRPAEFSVAHRWETPSVGLRKRAGVFDENNGIYFEDGGDQNYYCVIRSRVSGSVVETRVGRQDWNGDRFDGLGPSGITADPNAIQLLVIEYEWYGAGAVHFNYVMNGTKHRIHTFYHANIIHDVYMSTPFLPIRFEIENINDGAGTFVVASCSFGLEGNSTRLGLPLVQQIPLPGVALGTANTFYPAISLRLKPGSLSGIAILEKLQFFTVDNTTLAYRIYVNPTLTGGTWVDHELPNSLVQVNTTATAVTGGTIFYRGIVPVNGLEIVLDTGGAFQLGRNTMGTASDVVTIALTAFNSNKTAVGTAMWREMR